LRVSSSSFTAVALISRPIRGNDLFLNGNTKFSF